MKRRESDMMARRGEGVMVEAEGRVQDWERTLNPFFFFFSPQSMVERCSREQPEVSWNWHVIVRTGAFPNSPLNGG